MIDLDIRLEQPAGRSQADVTERLMARFEGRVHLAVVAEVVRSVLDDIHLVRGRQVPPAAEAEAQQRLERLAAAIGGTSTAVPPAVAVRGSG
jgi:hypothetical protein